VQTTRPAESSTSGRVESTKAAKGRCSGVKNLPRHYHVDIPSSICFPTVTPTRSTGRGFSVVSWGVVSPVKEGDKGAQKRNGADKGGGQEEVLRVASYTLAGGVYSSVATPDQTRKRTQGEVAA